LGDQGFLVVVPHEGANVIERLPQNDGDEFDFVANRSAQQVAGAKSLLLVESRQKLRLQPPLMTSILYAPR